MVNNVVSINSFEIDEINKFGNFSILITGDIDEKFNIKYNINFNNKEMIYDGNMSFFPYSENNPDFCLKMIKKIMEIRLDENKEYIKNMKDRFDSYDRIIDDMKNNIFENKNCDCDYLLGLRIYMKNDIFQFCKNYEDFQKIIGIFKIDKNNKLNKFDFKSIINNFDIEDLDLILKNIRDMSKISDYYITREFEENFNEKFILLGKYVEFSDNFDFNDEIYYNLEWKI